MDFILNDNFDAGRAGWTLTEKPGGSADIISDNGNHCTMLKGAPALPGSTRVQAQQAATCLTVTARPVSEFALTTRRKAGSVAPRPDVQLGETFKGVRF